MDPLANAAPVAPWEDGLRTTLGRGAYEWWYVDLRLDDGSLVVANLLTRPTARWRGPLRPKLELSLVEADGEVVVEERFGDPARFRADSERCVVAMDGSRLEEQDGAWLLHLEGQRLRLHARMQPRLAPWRAGELVLDEAGEHRLGWLVALPRGRAEGWLELDGRRRPLAGTAYHDHTWGTAPLHRHLDRWHWGHGQVGPWTLCWCLARGSRRHDRAPLSLLYLAREDPPLVAGPVVLADRSPRPVALVAGQPPTPGEVRLTGGGMRLVLRHPRVIDSRSLAAGLPPVLRSLAEPLGAGWYLRADVEAELDVAGEQVHGSALCEWMLFR